MPPKSCSHGDGYAATTMNAIADEADVAVQTLYAVFGNKRALLTTLINARVAGDDQTGPLRDREDWQAMERETDPHRQSRGSRQSQPASGHAAPRSTR